jgi:peptidoglycan/xylan/chitin deacetylase (PgdA/CDA1 family)
MKAYKKNSRLAKRLIRTIGDRIAPRGKGDGRLCIVNYHRVLEYADPLLESEPNIQTFRWQMELLAECFNVLPLYDAALALTTERMPPRAIAITFDDGYRSILDFAVPILHELGLPATVFVASGYLDENNMWNDRIIKAVQLMTTADLDLREAGLGVHPLKSPRDRKAAVEKLTEIAKYFEPKVRLALAQRLENLAGVDTAPGLMVTRKMLERLANSGVDIGAHTISHPILTKLNDQDAWEEIASGKQQLEAIIGKPVKLFAYPNGKAGHDFNERHVRMAQEAGFSAAFTTSMGAATSKHDRFQLPRSRPWDSTPTRFGFRLLRWLAG